MTESKFKPKIHILDDYRTRLVKDLIKVGEDMFNKIDEYCVKITTKETKTQIFFIKLQADIRRYLAEHSHGEKDLQKYRDEAEKLYIKAETLMNSLIEERVQQEKPPVIEALKLSLTLNYAVFLYEIANNQKKRGYRMIKNLIQEALDDFDKWELTEIDQIKHQIELI